MLDDYLKELQHITLLSPTKRSLCGRPIRTMESEARSASSSSTSPWSSKKPCAGTSIATSCPTPCRKGRLGLIEAVERYDYRRGVAFPLFAVHRIRGAILDYLKREGAVSAVSLDEPDERA